MDKPIVQKPFLTEGQVEELIRNICVGGSNGYLEIGVTRDNWKKNGYIIHEPTALEKWEEIKKYMLANVMHHDKPYIETLKTIFEHADAAIAEAKGGK